MQTTTGPERVFHSRKCETKHARMTSFYKIIKMFWLLYSEMVA